MQNPTGAVAVNATCVLFVLAIGLFATAAIARQQPELFSEGDAYERFMGRWSGQLAPLLVRFAGVRDGDYVLDIGSGTGKLTAAIASAAPSSRVVGVDPSASYVRFAQSLRLGDRVRFEVGDGQDLKFENRQFDRTVSLLVLNFIPDAGKAVAEMIRVTRPGGTIAAAVWDYGGEMEMLRVFWDEGIALKPDLAARDERNMPFCRQGELGALWSKHGLQNVTEEPITIPLRFSSFADYWAPFLDKQGPAGAFAAILTAAEREQLRLRLRRRFLGDGSDRPIELKARAWAVRGTVAP